MIIRRPFIVAFVITCGFVLFLTACDLGLSSTAQQTAAAGKGLTSGSAGPTTQVTTAAGAKASAAAANGRQGGTLSIRVVERVGRLTPWDLRSRGEEQAAQLLYNGLVRLDATGLPQPDLAERWTVAPGGGIITFTMRSDLKWHDGQPLTGDDVAWTLNNLRAITPTNSLLYDLQHTIGSVRTPISGTVVLSLTNAYAPILADLAVPILPRHVIGSRTVDQFVNLNYWELPVGSGPFQFANKTDQAITLTRNNDYFRGAPNLDKVVLTILPDDEQARTQLGNGQLLAAEFPTPTNVLTLTGMLSAGRYVENGNYWLAFNVRQGRLFADPSLRTAIAQLLDVPAIVKAATGSRGVVLGSSVLPGSWADPGIAPTAVNLDAARQALDRAGWQLTSPDQPRVKNGAQLKAQLFVRGDDPRRVNAANAIAAALKPVGIEIDVVQSPFNTTIVSKLAPPYDWDLLLGSWVNAPNSGGFATNSFYDPDDSALFASDRVWKGAGDNRNGLRNIGGYASAAYDRAAATARSTYDPAARKAAIAAAETVIVNDHPYIFLWSDGIPVVISSKLKTTQGDINLQTARYLDNIEQWYLQP